MCNRHVRWLCSLSIMIGASTEAIGKTPTVDAKDAEVRKVVGSFLTAYRNGKKKQMMQLIDPKHKRTVLRAIAKYGSEKNYKGEPRNYRGGFRSHRWRISHVVKFGKGADMTYEVWVVRKDVKYLSYVFSVSHSMKIVSIEEDVVEEE